MAEPHRGAHDSSVGDLVRGLVGANVEEVLAGLAVELDVLAAEWHPARFRSGTMRGPSASMGAMRVVAVILGAAAAVVFFLTCEAILMWLVLLSWPTGG